MWPFGPFVSSACLTKFQRVVTGFNLYCHFIFIKQAFRNLVTYVKIKLLHKIEIKIGKVKDI